MAYIKALSCFIPPFIIYNDQLQLQLKNCDVAKTPLALKDYLDYDKFKRGDKVLIAGFGVGLSWAGTVLTFK